ncbi:ArsR/SmtB family transcription factor [Archaeoglobus sp.]
MITLKNLVDICEALSHPLRVKVLKMLLEREWSIYELAKELKVSRQLLYLHVRKLEKAGLVESDIRLEELRVKRYYRAKKFKIVLSDELIRNLEV